MARRRLAVALLLPERLALEVDGLRRALGGSLDHVAPHITLVPPVNVREEDLPAALDLVQAAARQAPGALRLVLGPPATFEPVNPVVHLAVAGEDAAQLPLLRDRLLQEPLARRIDLPFVPHVTLDEDHPPERTPAALAALDRYVVDAVITHVDLLEDGAPGPHRWSSIATVRLGAPRRGDPRRG